MWGNNLHLAPRFIHFPELIGLRTICYSIHGDCLSGCTPTLLKRKPVNNEPFKALYDELAEDPPPLLAHYTSFEALESIVRTNELWFSNPLFMNDSEELRFGIAQGHKLAHANLELKEVLNTTERYKKFFKEFDRLHDDFLKQHAIHTYVFCLSHHRPLDADGLLSMWRGYGVNGDGVALVLDTSKLPYASDSPFTIGKIRYLSSRARIKMLRECTTRFSKILSEVQAPNDHLSWAAFVLFDQIKLRALYTKHVGFREEKEWRIVYCVRTPSAEHDPKYKSMFHYSVGSRGAQPKLKYKIGPVDLTTGDELSLEKLTDHIILGPRPSELMPVETTSLMFEHLERPLLQAKVRCSTIPFRTVR